MNTVSSRRGASSELRPSLVPTPSLLPSVPLDSSIRAYNCRRIRSRNQRGQQSPLRLRPKLAASGLGDVFEAADSVFRSSLAFRRPAELTLPPCRREIHKLWRSSLMAEEYEQAKTERIRRSNYASNYRIEGMGEWYRGRPL